MLETDDIFLGALALVRGGELRSVHVRGMGGRRLAVFRIEGDAVGAAESDYYRGDAVVNLQLLKFQVRRLKDRAFDAIREEERRYAGQQGRDRADSFGESHRGRAR